MCSHLYIQIFWQNVNYTLTYSALKVEKCTCKQK
nr:MAG TPA: hypothetical protein [Caudoviricetes sp.]